MRPSEISRLLKRSNGYVCGVLFGRDILSSVVVVYPSFLAFLGVVILMSSSPERHPLPWVVAVVVTAVAICLVVLGFVRSRPTRLGRESSSPIAATAGLLLQFGTVMLWTVAPSGGWWYSVSSVALLGLVSVGAVLCIVGDSPYVGD